MPRPRCCRRVAFTPSCVCFKPAGVSASSLAEVSMTLDEFEAMRLSHLEKREQGEIAALMGVHASTVCRMLACAHEKITDALLNLKAIRVEGGCCEVVKNGRKRRIMT